MQSLHSMQSTTENQAVLQATLQRGIDAHLAGQLEQAAQIYRDVLDRDPIEPVALHYLGIYLHQIGEHDEALEKLVLSTALESDNAGWHNDLGNVLFALQRFEDAAQSYADALAITPDDHSIWNNLGAVHLQLAEKQEAIAAFKRAVELAPEFVPALTHLGSIYQADGNKMEASHYQCRAFVVPPLEGKSKEMLGISFYFLGRLAEAAEIYRAWLQEEPGHPIAAHLMAACSQSDVPERASDSYIEFHFDRYAETFDANLLNSLAYRGPQLIGLGLELVGAPAHQFEVIDIGCGTGLCGPFLAPFSKHIVGVDLAGKMLGKARSGGHYTQLEKAEIGDYLSRNPGSCDLVTAADTMIYFGDLGPVFGKVAKSLRDDGYFIFTIEVVTATDQAPGGYCLHASGRYRHGLDYVTHHLRSNGLQLLHHSEQILREEIRQSVAGLLFVARRLPS